MTVLTFKTKEDAPNYVIAASPATSCSMCKHFQMRWCTEYDFDANPSYTCDSWQSRLGSQVAAVGHIPVEERVPIGTMKEVRFIAFKDIQGNWRWILKSGNAFEDRDGELVTTKALERDVMRTDKTLEFGPLRWWHVGNPQWVNPLDWRSVVAGKGLDIGDCDFSAMDGPVLIESGTFRSPAIGAAIALKAGELKASLGFSHPLDEPDQDGLFHHIKRFERSLTPANKASNSRTGLVVTKERIMDPKKLAAFKELVGEDLAEEALQDAQSTTKEARGAGIREKSEEPEEIDVLSNETDALLAQIASFKAKAIPKDTTATNVDDGDNKPVVPNAVVESKAHEEPDGDEEVVEEGGDGEEVYIGDMTGPEFVGLLQEALGPMFESHTKALDLHGKLAAANDSMREMKQYMGGLTTQKEVRNAQVENLTEQVQKLQIALKEAVEMVEELSGSVPKELARPRGQTYKASEGVDNIVPENHPMYQVEGNNSNQPTNPLTWIDSWVIAQPQQDPSQQGTIVPGVNGRPG